MVFGVEGIVEREKTKQMGNDVGELFYAVEISEEEFSEVYDRNANTSKLLVAPYKPYEVEEYFVVVNASRKSAYNCSIRLGEQLPERKEDWNKLLSDFLDKHNLKQKKPAWFLVGRYD